MYDLYTRGFKEEYAALQRKYHDQFSISLVIPLIVLILTYLSYMLLYGSIFLNNYTDETGVFPTALLEVKTVLHGFTGAFIVLTFIFICTALYKQSSFFEPHIKELSDILKEEDNANPVKKEFIYIHLLNHTQESYLRRKWNKLLFWRKKLPKTILFSAFLFGIISVVTVLCVIELCCTTVPAMMLLCPSVVAMMIYMLRLLLDRNRLLLCYFLPICVTLPTEAKQPQANMAPDSKANCDVQSCGGNL